MILKIHGIYEEMGCYVNQAHHEKFFFINCLSLLIILKIVAYVKKDYNEKRRKLKLIENMNFKLVSLWSKSLEKN